MGEVSLRSATFRTVCSRIARLSNEPASSLGGSRSRYALKSGGTLRERARRTTSPSETNKAPNAASHNRIAFSSIASNTGARSPGEALITCNTSAARSAAPAPRAARSSSRAFSIAITACAAKLSNTAISPSENGRTSCRNALIKPSRMRVLAQRHREKCLARQCVRWYSVASRVIRADVDPSAHPRCGRAARRRSAAGG